MARTKKSLKRYLRKNMLYVIGMALILGLAILLISIMSKANQKISENSMYDYGRQRQYAEYIVKEGDTLWSISADMASVMPEYGGTKAYLKDLRSVNRIGGDTIKVGQSLILPYYDKGSGQSKIFLMYGILPNVN